MVITGLGIVAPNGIGKEAFWNANKQGISGINLISDFNTSQYNSKIAGQVKEFDPSQYLSEEISKRTDRFVHLGLVSAIMALQDSRLNIDNEDRTRIGVICGSGLGGVLFHEQQILRGYEKGTHRLNPLCVPRITPNALSSQIAIYFDILGINMTISNACSSGTNAVGEAFKKIQQAELDIVVSAGAEAPLTEFTFGAYDAMRVLSGRNDKPQEASCPFDKRRDGFILAEAGASLILEELNHALKRGSNIYAELGGYFGNSGAHHMVLPKPDGEDVVRVMKGVLKDAGVNLKDIDYINAHGTSTVWNDRVETKAIKDVFGDHAYKIPVSSTKSMTGHAIGAAGAIESLVCCLAISDNFIPPTVNYECKDSECDLDYVPGEGRESRLECVLSNSFGFGSNNACLIFRRYDG